jgi:hypothetical protein
VISPNSASWTPAAPRGEENPMVTDNKLLLSDGRLVARTLRESCPE